MRLLLDTHLLLWAADGSERLSKDALALLEDADNELLFSAANIWELVIKSAVGRADFNVDVPRLRKGLLENGYDELPITGGHTLKVQSMPDIHRDPFDRILVAQALSEGLTLLTSDRLLQDYSPEIRLV